MDSTPNLYQLAPGGSNQEARVNELVAALSLGSYFAQNPNTTTGLTWGYYGGKVLVNGTPTAVANGTVSLTASTTNYVQLTQAGTIVTATSRDPRYAPLYSVVTGTSSISSYTDERDAAAIARLSEGSATQAMADANQTITQPMALCGTLVTTGALTATRNLVVPLVRRAWDVFNDCTGGSIQVIGASGTGVTIAAGKSQRVFCDATNVRAIGAPSP